MSTHPHNPHYSTSIPKPSSRDRQCKAHMLRQANTSKQLGTAAERQPRWNDTLCGLWSAECSPLCLTKSVRYVRPSVRYVRSAVGVRYVRPVSDMSGGVSDVSGRCPMCPTRNWTFWTKTHMVVSDCVRLCPTECPIVSGGVRKRCPKRCTMCPKKCPKCPGVSEKVSEMSNQGSA